MLYTLIIKDSFKYFKHCNIINNNNELHIEMAVWYVIFGVFVIFCEIHLLGNIISVTFDILNNKFIIVTMMLIEIIYYRPIPINKDILHCKLYILCFGHKNKK